MLIRKRELLKQNKKDLRRKLKLGYVYISAQTKHRAHHALNHFAAKTILLYTGSFIHHNFWRFLIRKTEQYKPGRITVLKTRNSNWNTDGIQNKYFSSVYKWTIFLRFKFVFSKIQVRNDRIKLIWQTWYGMSFH
jgi:hypothetical protein